MKRVIASLFGTVAGLVMLLSFKTHTQSPATLAAVAPTGDNNGNGPTTGGSPAARTVPSTGVGSSSTHSSSTSGTYTGDSVNTRWGPVQVRITVSNGKITSANAIVYPSGNPRDQQINSYALPTLNSEAVSASSARIDMVSGATVTSTGYLQSLQSALDRAGL